MEGPGLRGGAFLGKPDRENGTDGAEVGGVETAGMTAPPGEGGSRRAGRARPGCFRSCPVGFSGRGSISHIRKEAKAWSKDRSAWSTAQADFLNQGRIWTFGNGSN
ncbi:MAG: hypothetical protein CW342_00985 [Thermoactinomycetaceae bacterium]|nr:hypothetical protein [Bacillota bacterium]MBO2531466.1 hypothetical protein [Thermoactinomycetaceae bacterium]